jgi:glycosyltransferase involved in cell wall biosynthesis
MPPMPALRHRADSARWVAARALTGAERSSKSQPSEAPSGVRHDQPMSRAPLTEPSPEVAVPKVSVIVPSYNYGRFLEECIRSVWAQVGVSLECIVVDDGSSDDSVAIARRLAAIAPVPTQVVALEHAGIVGALNAGLALCRGEFVSVLAADDRFRADKSLLQMQALERQPQATLVHCGYRTIDAHGLELSGSNTDSRPAAQGHCLTPLLLGTAAMQTGYMLRRSFLQSIGGFDPGYPHDDWPLYLKAAHHGPIAWVDAPLVDRRIHGQNWSSTRFGRPEDVFTHAAVQLIEAYAPDRATRDAALAYHLTRPLRVGLHSGEVAYAGGLLRLLIRRYPQLTKTFLREAGLGSLSLLYRHTGKRLLPPATALRLSALARRLLDRQ